MVCQNVNTQTHFDISRSSSCSRLKLRMPLQDGASDWRTLCKILQYGCINQHTAVVVVRWFRLLGGCWKLTVQEHL